MTALSELVLLALSLGTLSSFREHAVLPDQAGSSRSRSMDGVPTEKGLSCPALDARFRLPGGDCDQYVVCTGLEPSVRACPPGMAFDSRYGHCRIAYEVNCDEQAPPPAVACGPNEVFTECGSPCERTCADLLRKGPACGYGCQEMCQCRLGYVRERVGGRCIKPRACPDLNSLRGILDAEEFP